MLDERTRDYLRQLTRALETRDNAKAINAAEEICQCADCARERMKKEITQCDKDRVLQYLPMKIVKPDPSNFIPDLSSNPNYWRLGRKG